MFDVKLREQGLAPWVHEALLETVGANDFPAGLGQTIGISDPHYAGGATYAMALAHALLCQTASAAQTSSRMACGHCEQCQLLKAGNHPDLMCLVPETLQADFVPEKEKKPSKSIKIEQVRAIENNFTLSAQRGGRKVVIVYPAHTLGTVPANALLKTLEEPPPATFFIVVSEQWAQVLPTIRSRCVVKALGQPDLSAQIAWLDTHKVSHPKRWLELAAGRVDKALAMSGDPLWMPLLKLMPYLLHGAQTDAMGLANDMAKSELPRVVEALGLWMCDVLAIAQGAPARFFAAQTQAIHNLVQSMNIESATQFSNTLSEMATMANHPLNARTQCEALLLEYKGLFK